MYLSLMRLLAIPALLVCAGCADINTSSVSGSSDSAAEDQIMLVRRQPASFGYQRLLHQTGVYPDLSVFIGFRGLPDFLAETSNEGRHYLILYYLEGREAFAARSKIGRPETIEIAGPYGITDREVTLLQGFKREAARRREALAEAEAR
jgi:hypothetical protein